MNLCEPQEKQVQIIWDIKRNFRKIKSEIEINHVLIAFFLVNVKTVLNEE